MPDNDTLKPIQWPRISGDPTHTTFPTVLSFHFFANVVRFRNTFYRDIWKTAQLMSTVQ